MSRTDIYDYNSDIAVKGAPLDETYLLIEREVSHIYITWGFHQGGVTPVDGTIGGHLEWKLTDTPEDVTRGTTHAMWMKCICR